MATRWMVFLELSCAVARLSGRERGVCELGAVYNLQNDANGWYFIH